MAEIHRPAEQNRRFATGFVPSGGKVPAKMAD
jgi:hypothetical protein